ncbi:MAG: hypothetical protein WBQ55_20090 [Xanthobacteraceae bacterium]
MLPASSFENKTFFEPATCGRLKRIIVYMLAGHNRRMLACVLGAALASLIGGLLLGY